MQDRLRVQAFLGLRERPGSVIQDRPSEHGPQARASGRCRCYGANHSGYLDDASIKATRCRSPGQQPQRVLA